MKCENRFCIYESKGECVLNNINIDSFGMCAECIYPDIDKEALDQAKLKLLKKYEKTEKIEAFGLEKHKCGS